MPAHEPILNVRSALAATPQAAAEWTGRDIAIAEATGVALTSITVHPERRNYLQARVRASLGLELPARGRLATAPECALMSVGPVRYLLASSNEDPRLSSALLADLRGIAAAVDVSDQMTVIVLSGADARRALARLCAIDFSDTGFPPRSVAVTRAEDVRAVVWRQAEACAFHLAVQRSLARGFWEVLIHTCEAVSSAPLPFRSAGFAA